jgi:hypothetical protein
MTISEAAAEVMDVLVFVPVYRLEPETVQAVLGLQWDGPISHLFQRDNPHPKDGKANHLHQYQRGRKAFLTGKYDAMLVIESDIIPPADALRKLAALNADCAYGVYRFRVSDVINIFERYPEKEGKRARNVGESLSAQPHLLKRAVRVGKYPCSGAGLGCILIRRKVLEAIDFRMVDQNGGHCDSWFTDDAYHAGYTQMADMSVICAHKDEHGDILWPRMPDKAGVWDRRDHGT